MKTLSIPWAAIVLLGLASAHLFPASITALFSLLLVWSLRGPAFSIQAMTLATLLIYLNPMIGVPPPEAQVLPRLILATAAIRNLPNIQIRSLSLLWPVWVFAVVAGALSVLSSSSVPISLMKVVTFAIAATTVLTAYESMSREEIGNLQRWFATVAIVFLAASLATLTSPRIAYYTNGTGFQGLMNNAQALAVVLAPFAAWQLTGVLFVRGYLRWLAAALLGLVYAGLFLSESRTGVAGSLIGVAAAGITWALSSRRTGLMAGRGRVIALAGAAVLMAAGALATGHLQDLIVKFALKHAESRQVSDAFLESRGGGVLSQWHNFLDQPWLGHGFGVYASGPPSGQVVEVMGIPISAPIEKGFVFTAVLEETGMLGGACFFTMLLVLGRAAWKNQDLRWLGLFGACIGVNIGECIFLSPGGIGLLDWLLIGLAISSARAEPKTVEAPMATDFPQIRFSNLLRS